MGTHPIFESDFDCLTEFKIKRLIRNLEKARGSGTSMISLIIPPKEQIAKQQKMLADEYGTASNIKSRVNRLSVLSAITATQQRLKLYNKVPPKGLVVYCGTIMTDEERDRTFFVDKASGVELEVMETMEFIEWLVETDETDAPNYKNYGCTLEIVTDRSQEGAQFVKGFGGIGGLLRYQVDFAAQEADFSDDDFDLDDY